MRPLPAELAAPRWGQPPSNESYGRRIPQKRRSSWRWATRADGLTGLTLVTAAALLAVWSSAAAVSARPTIERWPEGCWPRWKLTSVRPAGCWTQPVRRCPDRASTRQQQSRPYAPARNRWRNQAHPPPHRPTRLRGASRRAGPTRELGRRRGRPAGRAAATRPPRRREAGDGRVGERREDEECRREVRWRDTVGDGLPIGGDLARCERGRQPPTPDRQAPQQGRDQVDEQQPGRIEGALMGARGAAPLAAGRASAGRAGAGRRRYRGPAEAGDEGGVAQVTCPNLRTSELGQLRTHTERGDQPVVTHQTQREGRQGAGDRLPTDRLRRGGARW
jgi:hypothetical protein